MSWFHRVYKEMLMSCRDLQDLQAVELTNSGVTLSIQYASVIRGVLLFIIL